MSGTCGRRSPPAGTGPRGRRGSGRTRSGSWGGSTARRTSPICPVPPGADGARAERDRELEDRRLGFRDAGGRYARDVAGDREEGIFGGERGAGRSLRVVITFVGSGLGGAEGGSGAAWGTGTGAQGGMGRLRRAPPGLVTLELGRGRGTRRAAGTAAGGSCASSRCSYGRIHRPRGARGTANKLPRDGSGPRNRVPAPRKGPQGSAIMISQGVPGCRQR